ncbi:MAG: hypothetical protein KatS3mg008_1314 [Acidimicrobiales bacterium]|nr:MAG: hypothetical protein KatS3mg008_1314 [Acidimicrobiales bacterium]
MEERQIVVVGGRSDSLYRLGRSLSRKGLVAAVCGLVLIFFPASTVALAVLAVAAVSLTFGIAELFEARERARRMRRWGAPALRGLVFVGFAAVLLAAPEPSLRTLVAMTGAVWAAGGLIDLLATSKATWEERDPLRRLRGWVSLLGGLVVAIWPGVTVRVVGTLVGSFLLVVGLVTYAAGRLLRRTADHQPPLRLERWS